MEALKWIGTYLKKYKYLYAFSLLLVILTSLTAMVNPFLTGRIIDQVVERGAKEILLPTLGLMMLVVVGKAIVTYFYQWIFEVISQNIILQIRGNAYKKLLELDFDYYKNTRTGDIMARMTGDTDAIRHFVAWVIYSILINVCIFVFAIISMCMVNPILTLLMVSVCPFIGILTYKMGSKVRPIFHDVREAYSRLNSVVQENISGNRVVKAFTREDFEIWKFEKENDNYKAVNVASTEILGRYLPILDFLASFLTVVMLVGGGSLVILGQMSLGDLVVFNGLLWALNNPMRSAGMLINDYHRFVASSSKIMDLLNTEPKIKNTQNPLVEEEMKGEVTFDNVSFKYEDVDALRNISFTAKPGQTIGIIGHTGAGKSTLVNLISRFYEPTMGRILIDGVDIRCLDIHALRAQVAIAMQDVFLFSDTIESNIAYGDPDASFEKVKQVAALAEAHHFIQDMPEGYDTIIGERGVGLSGGQRQRIALARALLRHPPILILDDTTSALDMETELKIQKDLNANLQKTTTFIIAHRISSVKSADLILVMDEGSIAERGTHESLIEKEGIYYEVYQNQWGVFDQTRQESEESFKQVSSKLQKVLSKKVTQRKGEVING